MVMPITGKEIQKLHCQLQPTNTMSGLKGEHQGMDVKKLNLHLKMTKKESSGKLNKSVWIENGKRCLSEIFS